MRDLAPDPEAARAFIYELSVSLSVWSVTSFFVGEALLGEVSKNPEFTISDVMIHLSHGVEDLQPVRQLQVVKLRGSGFNGGKHFCEIDNFGMHVYPRVGAVTQVQREESTERVLTGVEGLDEMLHGGLIENSSTIIEGPTGSGKPILSLHFLNSCAERGEKGIYFAFEERPFQIETIASGVGINIKPESEIIVEYTDPVELNASKWLDRAIKLVDETGATRVVIDGLSSILIGLNNERRFRDLIYSVMKLLRAKGVTSLMTIEIPEMLSSSILTGHGVSWSADSIIILRYVEVEAQLKRAIAVLKMRGSDHDKSLKEITITKEGLKVGEEFRRYRGVLTGQPLPAE